MLRAQEPVIEYSLVALTSLLEAMQPDAATLGSWTRSGLLEVIMHHVARRMESRQSKLRPLGGHRESERECACVCKCV